MTGVQELQVALRGCGARTKAAEELVAKFEIVVKIEKKERGIKRQKHPHIRTCSNIQGGIGDGPRSKLTEQKITLAGKRKWRKADAATPSGVNHRYECFNS
eukprot:1161264-Pelagomonas_calceolata.AAC.4